MTKLRIIAAVLFLTTAACAQTVRIGVLGLFHPTDLTVAPESSPITLDFGREAVVLDRGSASVHLSNGRIHLAVGARAWDIDRLQVHARNGQATGLVLAVPGKIHRAYRGVLEIAPQGRELAAVVTMDLEVAVASVVAAESPPGAPLEALKAQAVASRSFLVAHGSGHSSFDFCDTTHCQFLREPPPDASLAARATLQTRGLVLIYREATLAAMYSRSCGGRTNSLAGLGLPVRDYPYYAVDCPYCRDHSETWTRELPRDSDGERSRLGIGREFGWSALPGNHYRVQRAGGRTLVEGSGQGHGLGLCQTGASAMARDGKTFRQILGHYYPNTSVTAAPMPR